MFRKFLMVLALMAAAVPLLVGASFALPKSQANLQGSDCCCAVCLCGPACACDDCCVDCNCVDGCACCLEGCDKPCCDGQTCCPTEAAACCSAEGAAKSTE